MRIVFMGTPSFAASILIELMQQHEVVAVYTRADAVRGRGKQLVASPVKEVALSAGIPTYEPASLKNADELQRLRELAPDAICVAAYGKILPQEVLDVPRFGCFNVHASLLPKYRGAAPIERAILNGDDEAGVCIMRMEAGLDTGDYCISRSVQIQGLNAEFLTGELADKGACALLSALYDAQEGHVRWTQQDESQASWAPKIEKGELNCHPCDSAALNVRRVLASSEAHPSKCVVCGKTVTLLETREVTPDDAHSESLADLEAGQVRYSAKRLILGCAEGSFEVLRIKPDGKAEMQAQAFASGIQNIKNGNFTWESK